MKGKEKRKECVVAWPAFLGFRALRFMLVRPLAVLAAMLVVLMAVFIWFQVLLPPFIMRERPLSSICCSSDHGYR